MLDVDNELKAEKKEISLTGIELEKLLERVNYNEEKIIARDVIDRLDEPYMFVVVGEVKSGKSSFINALLAPGKTICKVAASPMTDTIQQIIYGSPEREEYVSQYLKRIYLEHEILKDIAVVDTPGTNTIIENHQLITEKFIPVSDLVIFVFEAKNPYRQSAWDFFNFVKEDWRKKVIFVLQQKDLLGPDDLEVNLNGVKDFAKKKKIKDPVVFAVSAKNEIDGIVESSGFYELRNYIEENITNGQAAFLKLEAAIDTFMSINDKLSEGMILRQRQYEADLEFRNEIKEILDKQGEKTNFQTDILTESILSKYDSIHSKYRALLGSRLGFFPVISSSFLSIFDKNESMSNWLNNFTRDLESDLKNIIGRAINDGIRDIAENIQMMVKLVDAKLQGSKTIIPDGHHIFSELADRRANVLAELIDTFSRFINQEENFYNKDILSGSSNVSADLLKGSGLAAIGIIITTLMHGIVFDITGGVLTALGVGFAGIGIGLKRKKILRNFNSELHKGKEKISMEVAEKIRKYVITIKNKIDYNFVRLDDFLKSEGHEINAITEKQQELKDRFQAIGNAIKSMRK